MSASAVWGVTIRPFLVFAIVISVGLFTMGCLRDFGNCTYFTDTTSVIEVLIPVVGAIYVLFWIAMLW